MSSAMPLASFAPAALPRIRPRTVLVASSDRNFRQRLTAMLTGLRWQVSEAETGAQAWSEAARATPEALIVDTWLPDLTLAEFVKEFQACYPRSELLTAEGSNPEQGIRSPYHQELLYALRALQDTDTAAWNSVPAIPEAGLARNLAVLKKPPVSVRLPEAVLEAACGGVSRAAAELAPEPAPGRAPGLATGSATGPATGSATGSATGLATGPAAAAAVEVRPAYEQGLPELVGQADCMLEVSHRIRRVAPRTTPVLIEGPTGSGKELVAEALHRLSPRSRKPFIAINCAAIPEALLEAELFGHTRGAFTGAVHGRMGRIEAADGGTLFLDEIGEMPLALQAKLLRFVECGELQRVGDNATAKVDVRVIAATHRPLAQHAQEGAFRSDLYFRLAVFLIRTPALADHMEDLPLLVNHFLEKMGRKEPVKQIDPSALSKLASHLWPGNVRELEHVLERAAILAGDATTLTAQEIDFGLAVH